MSAVTSTDSDGLGPLEADAVEAVLGANPFVGLDTRQMVAAAARLLSRLGLQPRVVARHSARLTADLLKVAVGRSQLAPVTGDKRWVDPTWRDNGLYRRAQQTYLAVCGTVDRAIGDAGLDVQSDLRSRFVATIVTEALAPTNSLLNPTAVKRAFETGGGSLVQGLRHLVSDVRHNGGMPSTVDRRPFVVGHTVARTPGAVVFRNEVLELLQYDATTETVMQVPLVYVPRRPTSTISSTSPKVVRSPSTRCPRAWATSPSAGATRSRRRPPGT